MLFAVGSSKLAFVHSSLGTCLVKSRQLYATFTLRLLSENYNRKTHATFHSTPRVTAQRFSLSLEGDASKASLQVSVKFFSGRFGGVSRNNVTNDNKEEVMTRSFKKNLGPPNHVSSTDQHILPTKS